jgi:hypothetical protein
MLGCLAGFSVRSSEGFDRPEGEAFFATEAFAASAGQSRTTVEGLGRPAGWSETMPEAFGRSKRLSFFAVEAFEGHSGRSRTAVEHLDGGFGRSENGGAASPRPPSERVPPL